jgi:hypothetical protein
MPNHGDIAESCIIGDFMSYYGIIEFEEKDKEKS